MRYTDKKKSNDNQKKAYNYLINKGFQPHHASAVVGNLMQESYAHLDSTIENSIGAVGIAQWLGPRRKDLEAYAKEKGKSFKDFDLQLDFLHKELTTTGNSWGSKAKDAFYNTKTAEEAAAAFVNKFERSGEKPGEKGYENRINNAKKVFLKFNDKNTYAKDESGNVVNINPEVATPEQINESPKVKAEFYNRNFGIIEQKFMDPLKNAPAKVEEAKEEIVEVSKDKIKNTDKDQSIKQALELNAQTQLGETEAPPLKSERTDPYSMDISVQGNEFFDFFIPELQEGGKITEPKDINPDKIKKNAYRYNLENNPERLKGEEDESYTNRMKMFKKKRESKMSPLEKGWESIKESQEKLPFLPKLLSEIVTSPIDIAYNLSDRIDINDKRKFKNAAQKSKDNVDLIDSSLDAIALLNPFLSGTKAPPITKQILNKLGPEVVQESIFEAINNYADGGKYKLKSDKSTKLNNKNKK